MQYYWRTRGKCNLGKELQYKNIEHESKSERDTQYEVGTEELRKETSHKKLQEG